MRGLWEPGTGAMGPIRGSRTWRGGFLRALWVLPAAVAVVAPTADCEGEESVPASEPDATFDPGTQEDREALFEYLVETTMERDAFASLPDHPVHREHPKGIDVVEEMERHRDALVGAESDGEMWLALHKLSNARKDRHLSVGTVEGGLEVPEHKQDDGVAPIRFMVDYADLDDRFFFVSDLGENVGDHVAGSEPALGDRVVEINGMRGAEYIEAIRPYWRYSSEDRLWLRVSEVIGEKRSHVPHDVFYRDDLELVLERPDGERYEVSLPYLDPGDIEWELHEGLDHLEWDRYFTRQYPGFQREPAMDGFETFNLFVPEDPDTPVVLLQWYGFRPDLPDAMDALMEHAEAEGLLDHDVVVDATRARGGSNGAYALARLQPERFRTTKHNLKVSDLSEEWVRDRLEGWREDPPEPQRGQDPVNEKKWLERDALPAFEEGHYYTNDVPFKGVQPPWGDATIEPAETHFTGDMVVWLGPRGGSHADQFAAQLKDNDLAHIMGMSTGGFSNSWSSTETLRFPTTGQPIAEFEWSMGHSIRPNGEILQYNTPEPHEYIPQTRDNIFDYYELLLDRSLEHLGYR